MARRKFEPNRNEESNVVSLKLSGNGVCDNKLYYAERIKKLRKEANLTQMELAKKLGLSRSAVLNWELGRTRPDISNIPSLCRALNAPIARFFFSSGNDTGLAKDELHLVSSYRNMNAPHQRFLINMASELEAMDSAPRTSTSHIRLLSLPYAEDAVAAGVGAEGFEAAYRQCYVHETPKLREADILFHVNGNSMEPTYPNGCTVIVKKTADLKMGEVGIFSVDGTLYIKEFRSDGLHSLNPDYPTMQSGKYGEIKLIGHVTGIMAEKDFASEDEIATYTIQK